MKFAWGSDKTGSSANGEVNDTAGAWPAPGAPLFITVFTAPTDPRTRVGYSTVASIVAKALRPGS